MLPAAETSTRTIGVRELRNETASVIAAVEAGERILLTNRGRIVGAVVPPEVSSRRKKPYMTRDEFLAMPKADRTFSDERRALRAAELADDLDWKDPWGSMRDGE